MLHLDIASAENVGKRVKFVRKLNKLSQVTFSKILGLPSSANVSNWENGHQRLSIEGALLINHHFGTTLDFLYLGRVKGLDMELVEALAEEPSVLLESIDSTK